METVLSYYSIVNFVVLWVGFIVALVVNADWLNQLWESLVDQPIVVQVILWILFMPIAVGLWFWQAGWPSAIKLLGLVGLVAWTGLAISSLIRVRT